MSAGRSRALPPGLLPAALVIFVIGGIGPNLDLSFLAIIVLLVGAVLLWRPGETPVLLFTFGLGWLGASIEIFNSNWAGRSLEHWVEAPGDMRLATILSLLGLLALACGARVGAGTAEAGLAAQARASAIAEPLFNWFKLYLIASAMGYAAVAMNWFVPGISQLVLGVITIKWAFFYMLAFAAFAGHRTRQWYWAALAFEIAAGTGGFFSDFKTPLIISFMAFVAAGTRATPGYVFAAGGFACVTLAFGIVWTAIKGDYRQFVSGGTGAQVVVVDSSARWDKLIELVGGLRGDELADATDKMIQRIAYVQFFGATLRHVPLLESHTDGELLLDALSRPFAPRVLFPDKTDVDDTARTNRYTGGIAGTEVEGTSISLGYIAEMYIDFGVMLMLPALAFIGWIYGATYRLLVRRLRGSRFMGMGFASMVLFHVGSLDNSFTKIFGGLVATLLVVWVLSQFVLPRLSVFRPVSR